MSATSSCWAPSWMSRSIWRRAASCAATIREREAASSPACALIASRLRPSSPASRALWIASAACQASVSNSSRSEAWVRPRTRGPQAISPRRSPGVHERRRQRRALAVARRLAVGHRLAAVDADLRPAHAEPLARGRDDRLRQLLEVERVLERRAEPAHELLAAERLAERPAPGARDERAAGGLEHDRRDDRHGDRELQPLAGGGHPEQRRDADVGAGDRDPQRHVDERAAHRPVDVEQVGLDEADDERRDDDDERADLDRRRQPSGMSLVLPDRALDAEHERGEAAVHRPAQLQPALGAQAPVAQREHDAGPQRDQREGDRRKNVQRRLEERQGTDVQRARDVGEHLLGGLRAARDPLEDRRRLERRPREQHRQRHGTTSAPKPRMSQQLVAALVRPSG